MPLTHLVCPHCEQNVEINVTSVTRSRECPLCAKPIILQFTTKESRLKRKALLTTTLDTNEPIAEAAAAPSVQTGDNSGPRVLEGDIRRRMLHDPEVQSSARSLVWGGAILGSLVLLVVLGNHFAWWSALGKQASSMVSGMKGDTGKPPESTAPGLQTVPPKTAAEKDAEPKMLEPAPEPVIATENAMSEDTKALRAVASFLSAKTVDERVKFVRDRSVIEPLMRSYYEKKGDGPVVFERVEAAEEHPLGSFTYSFFVVLPSGENRTIMAGKAGTGEYLVDWASFVLYGEMEWKDFMQQKPEKPVLMRVLATVDDYYNHNFIDPQRLGCLKLLDPREANTPPIFCYYVRSSTLGREMEFIMRKSFGEAVPLVLTLKYLPDSDGNNQVMLDERIAEGWIARGR
jgi:hypothetical protein